MLEPFEPVLKFITIKSIIFLSFWQGVLLAIMEKVEVIKPISSTTSAGSVAAAIQNFLICIELLLAAIGLWFAFPYSLYGQSKKMKMRSASIYLISSGDPQPTNNNTSNATVQHSNSTAASESDTWNGSASIENPVFQTLSSRLKETFNPSDFVHDAVINFHPTYQNYIQQTQKE